MTAGPPPLHLPPPDDAAGEPSAAATGEVTFIGTATVLLQIGGFTILTDPNFLHAGERAYLGLGLHSTRRTEPAMQLHEVPPLDFVVLSHHHGDHFDDRVARELDKATPIITEPHSARKLRSQGFERAITLETWQTQVVTKGDAAIRVTGLPGKHAPRPLGWVLPPVMGSMLTVGDGADAFHLYITGDTLYHDRLAEIPRRYPDIDLCLLHLGGTRVAGVLLTMDAEQGTRALRLVRPRQAIPIHHEDYGVFRSPLSAFLDAAAAAQLATEIKVVPAGSTHRFTVR